MNVDDHSTADQPLAGLRVLVVDDDALIRDIAKALLELAGATVTVARDGAEAVSICLAASDIDIVIIDKDMPVLGGLAATMAIRSHRSATELPIIGMSSSSEPADQVAGHAAGMNEYLSKPYDIAQVIPALLRHGCPGRPAAKPCH